MADEPNELELLVARAKGAVEASLRDLAAQLTAKYRALLGPLMVENTTLKAQLASLEAQVQLPLPADATIALQEHHTVDESLVAWLRGPLKPQGPLDGKRIRVSLPNHGSGPITVDAASPDRADLDHLLAVAEVELMGPFQADGLRVVMASKPTGGTLILRDVAVAGVVTLQAPGAGMTLVCRGDTRFQGVRQDAEGGND